MVDQGDAVAKFTYEITPECGQSFVIFSRR
jgi:hypothetical protein